MESRLIVLKTCGCMHQWMLRRIMHLARTVACFDCEVAAEARLATPEDLTAEFILAREKDGSADELRRTLIDDAGTVRPHARLTLELLGLSAILMPPFEDGGER